MDNEKILLGELSEFKRATIERMDRFERKMDKLLSFKWRQTGAIAAIVVVFESAMIWLRRG